MKKVIELREILQINEIILIADKKWRVFTFVRVDGSQVPVNELDSVKEFLEKLSEITNDAVAHHTESDEARQWFHDLMEAKLIISDFEFVHEWQNEWNPLFAAISNLRNLLCSED